MDKKLKAQKIISPLLIVLAALIWGISFVAQSEGGVESLKKEMEKEME